MSGICVESVETNPGESIKGFNQPQTKRVGPVYPGDILICYFFNMSLDFMYSGSVFFNFFCANLA